MEKAVVLTIGAFDAVLRDGRAAGFLGISQLRAGMRRRGGVTFRSGSHTDP